MGKKTKVDECCRIPVAPLRVQGARGRISRDSDLEALFEQVAQVRFDTHVRQHPAEDDLAHATLAQLQHQVVGLRPKHPVRASNDRLPVLYIRLETLEPVSARPGKAIEV